VISIFHETKISMTDMKVQVYSKFWKNKIWKKVKSTICMRNGRFHIPKCKGKLQKMGVLYIHSHGPFPKFNKKDKFYKKNGNSLTEDHGRRATAAGCPTLTLCKIFFILLPFFFVHVVSSCWLAPTHATCCLDFS
jgi:hypothetical protein